MKRILILLLFLTVYLPDLSSLANWRPNEMRIKITNIAREDITKIATLDIEVDEINLPVIYLYVTPVEYERLLGAGFRPEVIIEDMAKYTENLLKNATIHGYYDVTAGEALADSLCRSYPAIVRKEIVGYSVEKRPIFTLKISDNVAIDEPEPEIGFEASHHGDEIISGEMLLRLAKDLCESYGHDPQITRLVNGREIWILPFGNPDGRQALDRWNKNQVDLNRDWGYMWDGWGDSSAPYSQPETRALLNWFLANQFVIAQSVHAGMEVISLPWSYRPGKAPDYDIIAGLAAGYAKASNYTSLKYGNGYDNLYPIHGTAKDSYYGIRGSLSWTMEVARQKNPPAGKIAEIYRHNRPAMLYLIEQAGMGLHGKVGDAATGKGVPAIIWVKNRQQEFWPVYADPQVGDFHKILPPGKYSLKVTANGYREAFLPMVEIPDSGNVHLEIALERTTEKYAYQVLACRVPDDKFTGENITYRALGAPDRRSYSLGRNGWIVLDMGTTIYDMPGEDLRIYEGDLRPDGFTLHVAEHPHGEWQKLGNGKGSSAFDLSNSGIKSFRYLRIEDDGDANTGSRSGFQLDAVEASNTPRTQAFPVPVAHAIVDTTSNFNGSWEVGETVQLDITLHNNGGDIARDVEIIVSCTDEQVTVSHEALSLAVILPGEKLTVKGISLTAEYVPTARRDIPLAVQIGFNGQSREHILPVSLSDGGRLQTVDELSFGESYLKFEKSLPLTVYNDGADTLKIFPIAASQADFYAPKQQHIIPPGKKAEIGIVFMPRTHAALRDTLMILSNDPRQPRRLISLSGTGSPAPALSVQAVDSLAAFLISSDSIAVQWTLHNRGAGTLNVQTSLAVDKSKIRFPLTSLLDAHGYLWEYQPDADATRILPAEYRDMIPQPLPFSEDDDMTPAALPLTFPFPYNGKKYTAVEIFPDGRIALATSAVNARGEANAHEFRPLGETDWRGSTDGVYYHALPEMLLIDWQQLSREGGGEVLPLKTTLDAAGVIAFYYPAIAGLMQDLQVQSPGAKLSNSEINFRSGMSITLRPRARFYLPPAQQSLRAGATLTQTMRIATRQLPEGRYPFLLTLQSNDPANPQVTIPLLLHINGELAHSRNTGTSPEKFSLQQNYPNPFNPSTTIVFQLSESTEAVLTVYNMLGQAVQVLVKEELPPGEYRVSWEGMNDFGEPLPSGIYFYELRAKDFVQIRKMVLLH